MIVHGDCVNVMKTLESESAQCVIADPPYNIGKDFGNNSDKQSMTSYLSWCDEWISESVRVLKPNGTFFIFGFSEILAHICARVPSHLNKRWLIWHYTNKTVPGLDFWQRSHESILVVTKGVPVFNRDDVREPYTESFVKNCAGKQRAATVGRFSKGEKSTVYNAHQNGALPRDVIKVPALAGGAGKKERVDHPTQKPLELITRLLKSCKQESGIVVVPFAGSGTECVAAQSLGMPFIGIELNPEYVHLCETRLRSSLDQTETTSTPGDPEALQTPEQSHDQAPTI
jgi:site-specific DNA-methyltransferase (adenine-specific)